MPAIDITFTEGEGPDGVQVRDLAGGETMDALPWQYQDDFMPQFEIDDGALVQGFKQSGHTAVLNYVLLPQEIDVTSKTELRFKLTAEQYWNMRICAIALIRKEWLTDDDGYPTSPDVVTEGFYDKRLFIGFYQNYPELRQAKQIPYEHLAFLDTFAASDDGFGAVPGSREAFNKAKKSPIWTLPQDYLQPAYKAFADGVEFSFFPSWVFHAQSPYLKTNGDSVFYKADAIAFLTSDMNIQPGYKADLAIGSNMTTGYKATWSNVQVDAHEADTLVLFDNEFASLDGGPNLANANTASKFPTGNTAVLVGAKVAVTQDVGSISQFSSIKLRFGAFGSMPDAAGLILANKADLAGKSLDDLKAQAVQLIGATAFGTAAPNAVTTDDSSGNAFALMKQFNYHGGIETEIAAEAFGLSSFDTIVLFVNSEKTSQFFVRDLLIKGTA